MKNKYEDIEMIELNAPEDIVDIFIEKCYRTDKVVGLVANKELIEYALDYAIALDKTSVYKIDLSMDDSEYLISIDDDGYITVVPVDSYKKLKDIDIFYISMDNDVAQDIIDECVDNEKDVILFGLYDEPVCKRSKCTVQKHNSHIAEYDTDDGYHVTVKCDLDATEALKIVENMEKRINRMNDAFAEMERFRRLFRW